MVKKSLEVEGMNPLISPEQLAALLGIGTEQVRKLTRDNLIPHHRVGGLLRYDYEAVKAATSQEYGETHKEKCEEVIRDLYNDAVRQHLAGDTESRDCNIARLDGATVLAESTGLMTPKRCAMYRESTRDVLGCLQ